MPLSLVVAVPTFVCSLLSFVASSAFAVCYVFFPPERHFRQALIVNLLISDWMNSLNNTVSGAIALARRDYKQPLSPGPACTANGYIGQWTVQATDFNILVISLAVLLTVRRSSLTVEPPWWQVVVVCAVPWIPGLITSNVAYGLDEYGPVSGNWCWVKPNLLHRYLLTHGWRWAIFATTIGIYTYIYIYLKRVYGKIYFSTNSSGSSKNDHYLPSDAAKVEHGSAESPRIDVRSSISVRHESSDENPLRNATTTISGTILEEVESRDGDSASDDLEMSIPKQPYTARVSISASLRRMSTVGRDKARERALRKMLLLNGYPLLYILLWIPGMANRITEVVSVSPEWLRALGATTQLVGFANALTYAWNESLFERIKSRYQFSRRRGRAVSVLPSRGTGMM